MAKRRARAAERAQPRSKAAKQSRSTTAPRPLLLLRMRPAHIAIALAVLHMLLAVLYFQPQMHNGGDNAAYLALARSLLDGNGYREIYDPAQPLHTQYPPVFPLLLAGLLLLGFQPWVPIKVLVMFSSTAAIVLSYYWMRRKGRPELAFYVAALMAVSPGVLGLSHWELSDVPFWAFTMAALLAWDRLPRSDRATRRVLLASALTLLAYFTRSAGLPLLVAATAWLVWRRRWKQLVLFGASTAPFILLWWWRARTQGGVDYVQQFWWVNPYAPELGSVDVAGLFRRAFDNNQDYLTRHLPLLLIGQANRLGIALSFAVMILAVIGWIRRLRRAQVSELFMPLYFGLLLAWPAVWSGERFLVPVLPLILFYAAETWLRLLRRLQPAGVRTIGLATAAAILVMAVPASVAGVRWGQACSTAYRAGDRFACMDPGSRDLLRLGDLAGVILPGDAVLLSRKPRLIWAVSGGRPGRNYPMSPEADSLLATARAAGARYVILDRVDRLSQAYLMPALIERPQAFCLVYSLGPDRAAILGVRPDTATIPEQPAPDPMRGVQFELCGPEYWRNPAMMESMLRR